jgi:hypothetical protein
MASEGGKGGTRLLLLVLLGALAGGGAWNYQRNLKQEESIPRPWKGYETAELQALAQAYRQEIEQYSGQWESARGERRQAADGGGVGDRAKEFDRVQSHGQAVRGLKTQLADREVVLGQIDEELRLRSGMAKGLALHLRRLTEID